MIGHRDGLLSDAKAITLTVKGTASVNDGSQLNTQS
jgi:hypothetical protein